jgi:MFS family permease
MIRHEAVWRFNERKSSESTLLKVRHLMKAELDRGEGRAPRAAWYFVFVATSLYWFSFIDRFILALLIDPISREIAISEVEMGLLIGANFAVVYAVAGFPLAYLIDRGNRRAIIAAGAVIWGLFTIASGFAHSFSVLAVSRIGVAIGEATLTPAVVSMLTDLFPGDRRILPMSIYNGVGGAMTKGVYLVGAGLIAMAALLPANFGIVPWRMTLVVVGASPILLGLLLLATVKEPSRRPREAQGRHDVGSEGFVHQLRGGARWYVPYYLSCASMATMTYAMTTWTPTVLVRTYGFSITEAGATYGAVGLASGLIGVMFWPFLVALLRRRGRSDGIPIALLLSSMGVVPFVVLYGSAKDDVNLLLVAAFGFGFMVASLAALGPLAVQTHGPPSMHARLIALMILVISMVGLSFGSFLVPLFASYREGDQFSLGYGVTMVGLMMVPIMIVANVFFWSGLARTQRAEQMAYQSGSLVVEASSAASG